MLPTYTRSTDVLRLYPNVTSALGALHREEPVESLAGSPGGRSWGFANRPIITSVGVALVARLIVTIVSFALNKPILIPDEGSYLTLATWVSSGYTADSWQPGYGQFLYDSTWAYVSPLVALFDVFGSSRLIGQLLSVVAGVGAVALGALIAARVFGRREALVTGLLLALLPSQVLFSSVAIRESMVWLGLVVVGAGVAVAVSAHSRTLIAAVVMCAGGLWLVGMLRDHTAVAACWALAVAAIVHPRRRSFAPVALALSVLMPTVTGGGPFGIDLVRESQDDLARTRANFSLGADSSFAAPDALSSVTPGDDGTAVGGDSGTAVGGDSGDPDANQERRPSSTVAPSTIAPTAVDADGRAVVTMYGKFYAGDEESLGANIGHLPTGLVAVLFRPFPGERLDSATARLAVGENALWLVLYVAAVGGLIVRRARWRCVMFPLVLTGVLVGIGAVTEGNLGTAFRHRGQVAWVVCLFAGAGVVAFLDGRRGRPAYVADV